MNVEPERAVDGGVESLPLTLYVHVPWCVRKCPYCDFNSHESDGALPERAYLEALLKDLDADLPLAGGRGLEAVFIGGGTPSLCSSAFYADLLTGVRERVALAADAEITLEANPGTVTERYLAELLGLGVNRLSVGVQSLDDALLPRIGRIHDAEAAVQAVAAATRVGFQEINVDLMFGLPGQTLSRAGEDVIRALALEPTHISYYQLTLESGTPFGRRPPPRLPDDAGLWEMQAQGTELLEAGGYGRYEVSAYARPGHQCRHNRNYWEFGDYLGIGAGAHGKITLSPGAYTRTRKMAHPERYRRFAGGRRCGTRVEVTSAESMQVEFLLNALRLVEGFPASLFSQRTGQSSRRLDALLNGAAESELLERGRGWVRPTAQGLRYLDELLARCTLRAG